MVYNRLAHPAKTQYEKDRIIESMKKNDLWSSVIILCEMSSVKSYRLYDQPAFCIGIMKIYILLNITMLGVIRSPFVLTKFISKGEK